MSVLDEVADERRKQDAKWGVQNHPLGFGPHSHGAGILDTVSAARASGKSHEEWAKFQCQQAAKRGDVTWAHIMHEEHVEAMTAPSPEAARAELIQLAAVCVAAVECIDRNK